MSTDSAQDCWARWVLRPENELESMHPVRDRVLVNGQVGEGDVLLDVGAGSGLIPFGALPLVGDRGRVIFSDVSKELLEHCRTRAGPLGALERCEFVQASADDLSALTAESVDVVTTRSVLIYVKDKGRAFSEFHRVLRPGGRLSIFEPINRFGFPEPEGRFLGYDVTPVPDLARKVLAVYERIQPLDDPMLDFDERDLLADAERAGFHEIRMTLEVEIEPRPWCDEPSWKAFLAISGNPRLPTVEQVLDEALGPAEKKSFCAHLRPLVERGEGVKRFAAAYLWAVKNE